MSLALAVALGAAAGAPARYLLDAAVSRRRPGRLPLGILAVNLLGCLAIGVLAGTEPTPTVVRLVGLGFLGSFTTASTVAWDVIALGSRSRRAGGSLLALHVLAGLALTALGLAGARALG